MASALPLIEQGSDEHCEDSCHLEFGLSEVFNKNIVEQQKIKVLKPQVKPEIFDNPTDQIPYHHMVDDVMFTTFDDPSVKKVFQKALEGMKSNYPEILQGTEKHICKKFEA